MYFALPCQNVVTNFVMIIGILMNYVSKNVTVLFRHYFLSVLIQILQFWTRSYGRTWRFLLTRKM